MSFYGKVNYGVGQTPTSVSVANSSTEMSAANTLRKWILITNIGNRDIWMSCDATALVDKGIFLGKNGGSVKMGADQCTLGAVNGITGSGSSSVAVQEGN